MNEKLPLLHPGILLKEDYLDEMEITPYRLAKETGLGQSHVAEMLKGRRNITASTSILLGRFLGQSPRFWLNMQVQYDLWRAQQEIGAKAIAITPFREKIGG